MCDFPNNGEVFYQWKLEKTGKMRKPQTSPVHTSWSFKLIGHPFRSGLTVSTIILLSALMSACGGGSSGGGNPSGNTSKTTAESSKNSSMVNSSSPGTGFNATRITRQNTPALMAGYLDLLEFAKETSVAIVNGDYEVNLPDGNYEEPCDNTNSKLQLTISNGGNKIIQKYTNCQLSISNSDGTYRVALSGEETIAITPRDNSPSTVKLEWNEYSLSVSGETPITLDGTFQYDGLLHFERSFTYINIYSHIKIDARIAEGNESMEAKNIEFKVDFPALFNRFGNTWLDDMLTPRGIHLLHQKVLNASGNLRFNNDAASFLLNAAASRVTFKGTGSAVSYLDNTQYGFFLRWDENADSVPEANIFLTETEYPFVIDNLQASTNPIYYVRYPDAYNTPYPPNHQSTGFYKNIDLSRGATIEIDVQELFTSLSGGLLTYEIDNERVSKNWEQIAAGKFLLKFPDAEGFEVFELKITAVDVYGNRSPAITARVHMNDNLADFDKDGIPDYQDTDIDNDGIPNHEDRFDKDPTEYSDLDEDGIGDNADDDRDNDGITNSGDAFPSDTACSKPESGDGESCYLTNSRYNFTDKNGIAYFIQEVKDSTPFGKSRFVRFDTINKHFLEPTPTIDWPSSFTYTYTYNGENHSLIVSNRTHDGYVSWQHVYILQLESFTITTINNSRNYDMYPAFHDYGYFVFSVSESTVSDYFHWIEVYDSTGKLISTSESEVRAAPKDDTYFNLQHSRGIAFCDFSVSINSSGNIVKNGQYENRYNDNCGSVMQLSENGIYGLRLSNYSFSLYDINKNALGEKSGYNPAWIGNKIVYVDGRSNNLLVTNVPSQETIQLDAPQVAGSEVYVSGKNILLTQMSGYQRSARLQLYTEDLQLIYDSAKF